MTVLLAGATGQLGGRIARELLSRRIHVRALCRRTSATGALRRMGAEIVEGDLRNPASLTAACAGADTVVTTANSARRAGDDTVDSVDAAGTRNLIDAARAAGVGHFVYTSVYGASAQAQVPFVAAKGANEEHLKSSGVAWTILAPNAFMDAWPGAIVGAPALAGRPVVLVGEGHRRHAFIAEHDVAQFAVAAVLDPAARNRHLPLGGPDGLSWRDVVSTYERVLGRSIDVRHVRPGEPIEGMPDVLRSLLTLYDAFETVFDTSALATEFKVPLTALDPWVRASIAASRGRV